MMSEGVDEEGLEDRVRANGLCPCYVLEEKTFI